MDIYNLQLSELYEMLEYNNYKQLFKRIIDFTLDTEELESYRKTLALLDWIEQNNQNSDLPNRLKIFIDDLDSVLKNKNQCQDAKILLDVESVTKSYRKSSFALGPISFTIKERQIIGLVGENGNGKTTLLRTLCKELHPSSGKLDFNFPYKDSYDLRSHLIYIPQRTKSWQGSLLSNLKFTAAMYGTIGEANELIVQLVIARMGLRKFRDYKWKDLSSGYKMRFELARALLCKPKLLFIDEPLANLDILSQQIVLDDLRDIARSPFRSMGLVFSSQQLYEVEKTSDDVIFLKNGIPCNLVKDMDTEHPEVPKFITEFETEWSIQQVGIVFEKVGLEHIQINGGTYVASFPALVSVEMFMQQVLNHKMPLTYFRDISKSTRRFFLY